MNNHTHIIYSQIRWLIRYSSFRQTTAAVPTMFISRLSRSLILVTSIEPVSSALHESSHYLGPAKQCWADPVPLGLNGQACVAATSTFFFSLWPLWVSVPFRTLCGYSSGPITNWNKAWPVSIWDIPGWIGPGGRSLTVHLSLAGSQKEPFRSHPYFSDYSSQAGIYIHILVI